MNIITVPVETTRHPAQAVIWSAAAAVLLASIAVATLEGAGAVALALLVTALAGSLVLIRPEFGVLALASTFLLSYPEVLQGSGSLTINNALGLLLAGILLVDVAVQRRLDFLRDRQVQMLALITAVMTLNVLGADSSPTFVHLEAADLTSLRLHEAITKLAFVVFVVAFVRARWQVVLLAAAVVLFVVMTAPNAIWNALIAEGQIEKVRASADFGVVAARNANRLAFLCGLAIALIAHAMMAVRSLKGRVVGAASIALLVVTVVLSASRSGLVNLVVLAALFARDRGVRVRHVVLLGVVAAMLALTLFVLLPGVLGLPMADSLDPHAKSGLQRYGHRLTSFFVEEDEQATGASGSTRARLELLSLGLRMAADHPLFGVGVGNFRWVSVVDYANTRMSAMHNSYMVTLVEGGVVLLVPYLLLFVVMWRTLRRLRGATRAVPEVALGWLVDATRSAFVMFLVFSFFAEAWHEVYLYLIIGLASVLDRLYADATPAGVA